MSTTSSTVEDQVFFIELHKGSHGLGFNIRGGTDNQQGNSDNSIIVTTIRPDGAAAVDGRLRVNDVLLSVNNVDVTNVRHSEAVGAFRDAKDLVRLKVLRRTAESEGPSETPTVIIKDEPSSISAGKILLVISFGAAVIAGAAYIRSKM